MEVVMKLFKKIILILLISCVIGLLLFIGVGFANYVQKTNEVSIEEKVKGIKDKKDFVRSDEISSYLLEATVTIEDHRFYDHGGVDYYAMARALVENIFAQTIVGGGSTITQQLAKNMYFTYQPSYLRKVSEIFVAYDLERELGKDDILELYVNEINYGDNYIGIYAASKGYFNKEPKNLTLYEASLLAGIPQSPSNFQLSNHLDDAKERQKQVLNAMVREEKITKEEMEKIIQS